MTSSLRAAAFLLASFTATSSYAGYAMPAPDTIDQGGTNWYVGAFVGPTQLGALVDHTDDISYRYNVGPDFGVEVGYRAHAFRFEGQFTYFSTPFKNAVDLTTGSTATLDAISEATGLNVSNTLVTEAGMLNMYYDFQGQNDRFGFYLGLGVGLANVSSQFKFTDPVNYPGYTLQINASQSRLAYQGMLGMQYNPGNHLIYDLGFRYLQTQKLTRLVHATPNYFALNFGVMYEIPA